MKPILLMTLVLALSPLGSAPTFSADVISEPDYSFLWNRFNSIEVIDNYAVAATDFGLAVLELDTNLSFFTQVNQLLLGNQAVDLSLAGDIATVSTSAGLLYFVDISNLPELTLISEADLGTNVHDALFFNGDLFLACGFDGLRHFRVEPGGVIQFIDSSLAPIHCIQVEAQGPYLVVLDDYNGLLRFMPTASSIGQVQSRIMVPRRARSFFGAGDTLSLALVDLEWVYRATFDNSAGILDSAKFLIVPENVFAIDSFLVAVDTRLKRLEMMSTIDGRIVTVTLATYLELDAVGDTYRYRGDAYLMLTSSSISLAGFNLKTLWYDPQPRQVYSHPGPVNALAFHQGDLLTGGARNPLESYGIVEPLHTERKEVLYSLQDVDAVVDGGDIAIVHTNSTNRIQAMRFTGDSVATASYIPARTRPTRGMKYFEHAPGDTASLLLVVGLNTVDIVAVSLNGTLRFGSTIDVYTTVADAIVIDSFLVVSTVDQQIRTYRIFNSLFTVFYWSAATTGSIDHMLYTSERHAPDGSLREGIALGFDGNQMYEVMIRNSDGYPLTRKLAALPIEVMASACTLDAVYGISPQGNVVIDIRQATPTMTAYGGYGGDLIAFSDSIMAVSDGSAIHLYVMRNGSLIPAEEDTPTIVAEKLLQPNYPNPFNPTTRIDFMVPEGGKVEIAVFDVLGRRVNTLIETNLAAGQHSVDWDGTDRSGNRVASGIYFYRMSTPRSTESRKMILLK